MENGDLGLPMAPAVLHVAEEEKSDLVPAPNLNMEVGHVQDQPQRVSAVTLMSASVRITL